MIQSNSCCVRPLLPRGIPFETESSLRIRGAYKTPDVRLIVPMAMQGPKGSWHIITWIDSKAMFGGLDAFEKEVRHSFCTKLLRVKYYLN